eukprot:755177-Rhodomonas_salina.1
MHERCKPQGVSNSEISTQSVVRVVENLYPKIPNHSLDPTPLCLPQSPSPLLAYVSATHPSP